MFKTSLALGRVWHKRYTPKIVEFQYTLNSFLIDIDDLDSLDKISKFISVGRFNLYYFKEANYLRDCGGDIKSKVRNKLIEMGAVLDNQEKILMLGQLANLGAYFSPINLYMCFNNNHCRYVLAEVSNTPWNQRHYYLIDMEQQPYVVKKQFHVSPFWGLNQDYHWTFNFTHSTINFQIDSYKDKQKVFSASYAAALVTPTTREQINHILIKSPCNIFKIIITIYYNALKLFVKKVPFVAHPNSNKKKG